MIAALAAVLLTACEQYDVKGFFASPSSGVDIRYEQSSAMAEPDNIDIADTDTYTVWCCGDIHCMDSADNFRSMLRSAVEGNGDPLIVIANGDLTDREGGLYEVRRIIDSETHGSETPHIFTSIGNHDLFFNQWEVYRTLFGRSFYSFDVKTSGGTDLFICLDTGNAQLGSSQKEWLENLLRQNRNRYRHCTIFTHTNLWLSDYSQFPTGSMPTQETIYLAGLAAEYSVQLFIQSHDHHRDEREMNGVTYVTLDAINDGAENASYLEVTYGDTLSYRFIDI